MAVPGLLPAASLERQLEKADKQGQVVNVNSPAVKKAIADAAKPKMVGPMSETNVVNAVAQVLWKEARGEGSIGQKAVASVILNRSGDDPSCIIDVLKEPAAFTCMNDYTGGWTDKTYLWYVPAKAIAENASNRAIWDECN